MEKLQGIRNTNGRYKIDRGRLNSMGNREAKELICMTHGNELKGGNAGGRGCAGQRGIKGGKWDSCNSIIDKIYFKKLKKKNYLLVGRDIYTSQPFPKHL